MSSSASSRSSLEDSLSQSFHSLSLSLSSGSASSSSKKRLLFHQSNSLILASLDHLLGSVSDPLPAPDSPVTTQQLEYYGETISHHMTKFVLFLSNLSPSDDPEPSMFIPLAEELTKLTTGLICSLRSLLARASATQSQAITAVSTKILSSIRADVESIDKAAAESEKAKKPFSTKEIGLVYEALKALPSVPLTNSLAIGRSLNSYLNLIKDLKNQISEIRLVESKDSGKASSASSADYEDDDEEFDDDEENDFSAEDYAAVPGCIDLINFAFVLTKKIYFLLLKFKISDDESDRVEWMEAQLRCVKMVSERLDLIGSDLYPPQNRDKLMEGFIGVVELLAGIVGQLRELALKREDSVFVENLEEKEKAWEEKDENVKKEMQNCPICKKWEKALTADVAGAKERPAEERVAIDRWAIKYASKLHQGHTRAEKAANKK